MLNTKYVLMFVVLSAGMLTALTATGVSLGQTAFADDEKYQRNGQENNCKIENENKDSDNSRVSDITNEQYCQNLGQNAKRDSSVDGDPFSGHNDESD